MPLESDLYAPVKALLEGALGNIVSILGEVPGVPGFHHCVTEYGYSLGPLCAKALALALSEKVVPFDLATYSVSRFSG
jgi:hypothetical protein